MDRVTREPAGACSLEPEVFGAHLLVHDPLDAAAISIGNYVKDSLGAVGHGLIATDLRVLIDDLRLVRDRATRGRRADAARP